MDSTNITPHHLYGRGFILQPISHFPHIPSEIAVGQKTFVRKSEFHVSILAVQHLVPIINSIEHTITEDQMVRDFQDYQRSVDFSTVQLSTDFRHVRRGNRESLIMMVDVGGVAGLFEYLREKYTANIPTQPTHVTLYTLEPDKGIGILSEQELQRDSDVIMLPDLQI